MEPHERKSVEAAIILLRRILLAVKLAPFVCSAACLINAFLVRVCSYDVMSVMDSLAYVSPLTVCILLYLSHALGLCKWHKIACTIPLAAQVFLLVDSYLAEFTAYEVLFFYNIYCVFIIFFLLCVKKIFFCDDRKRIVRRQGPYA